MYAGGTEGVLTAQTDLMLIVIANVLGFQSQCKSVRLAVQYRLWPTVLFEIQCEGFVFRVGVTYWHSWGPRERATAVRFPVRARVFVAKMLRPAVVSTRQDRGSFPEEKSLELTTLLSTLLLCRSAETVFLLSSHLQHRLASFFCATELFFLPAHHI
jgi:hypothetical protein